MSLLKSSFQFFFEFIFRIQLVEILTYFNTLNLIKLEFHPYLRYKWTEPKQLRGSNPRVGFRYQNPQIFSRRHMSQSTRKDTHFSPSRMRPRRGSNPRIFFRHQDSQGKTNDKFPFSTKRYVWVIGELATKLTIYPHSSDAALQRTDFESD